MKPTTYSAFCRALVRKGWVKDRQTGKHRKYRAADGRVVVVPYHGAKTMKVGLQSALMRQAGLTDADL